MLQEPVQSARNHLLLLAIDDQSFHRELPLMKFFKSHQYLEYVNNILGHKICQQHKFNHNFYDKQYGKLTLRNMMATSIPHSRHNLN